jgi:hypothetical protein
VFVAGHVKTIFDAQKTLKKRGGNYFKCPCIINGTMNSSISDHRIKINGGKTKEKEPYDSLYLFFFILFLSAGLLQRKTARTIQGRI